MNEVGASGLPLLITLLRGGLDTTFLARVASLCVQGDGSECYWVEVVERGSTRPLMIGSTTAIRVFTRAQATDLRSRALLAAMSCSTATSPCS